MAPLIWPQCPPDRPLCTVGPTAPPLCAPGCCGSWSPCPAVVAERGSSGPAGENSPLPRRLLCRWQKTKRRGPSAAQSPQLLGYGSLRRPRCWWKQMLCHPARRPRSGFSQRSQVCRGTQKCRRRGRLTGWAHNRPAGRGGQASVCQDHTPFATPLTSSGVPSSFVLQTWSGCSRFSAFPCWC